jgi:hypothetical protein
VFLLVSMVSSIFLIVDYLLSRWVAIVLGAVAALWFLFFWACIPLYRHNWIDEANEVEEEALNDDDPMP